jgi:hypothetical protein
MGWYVQEFGLAILICHLFRVSDSFLAVIYKVANPSGLTENQITG